MSVNKYMHPRNIYKKPPDFKQMAIDFPEFRQHIKQDISGKVTIDFKDVKALRALTCTLLKKDFDLNIDIPLDKMIPTVPLRLNYILWIEDLLTIFTTTDKSISGVDIGTGASCVYCLLAAKNKGWRMTATELDDISIKYAKANVDRNHLNNLIEVRKVQRNGSLLADIVGDAERGFDFCMCNPPFFASSEELNPLHKARRPDRPRPKNAFCAAMGEVVAEGGEVNFVARLIEESQLLKQKIRIYTTMVGHKSSLPPLKKLLREANVNSFKQTEFYQGNTVRWALAWTFHDTDLRTIPEETVAAARKSKSKPPLIHIIKSEDASLEVIDEQLKTIFSDLQIQYEEVKHSRNVKGYCLTAASNTWSHQRRRRRTQQRLNSVLKDEPAEVESAVDLVAQMSVASPNSSLSPPKREHESDDDEESSAKKFKEEAFVNNNCYLKTTLVVRKEKSEIAIELSFIEGSANKDGLHQVLQYIKNHIRL